MTEPTTGYLSENYGKIDAQSNLLIDVVGVVGVISNDGINGSDRTMVVNVGQRFSFRRSGTRVNVLWMRK